MCYKVKIICLKRKEKNNEIRINLQKLKDKQENTGSEIRSKEKEVLGIIKNLIGEKDQERVKEITESLISIIAFLTDEQRLNLQQMIDRIEGVKVKEIDTGYEDR